MSDKLPLMEAFYTIQGEGFHQGKAAYFIRLAGCDVGCHWCDVKDSWDAGKYEEQSIDNIVEDAGKTRANIAVVTGGEPLLYDLTSLTGHLNEQGLKCHIETSGAHPLTGKWDWICFSPKKFKKPEKAILDRADELKIVIYNKRDFDWAETYKTLVNPNCKLYLQPEWEKSDRVLPLIIDYIKENPDWEISLQTHKFMNIP